MSENRIIGVIGTGPAVGVTHFCVTMANYLSGVQAHSVALLSWGDQDTYERMEQTVMGKRTDGTHYHLLDVEYYKQAGPEQLADCINRNYQHIILDFGAWSEENKTEFYRCDRKLFLASFSEWQMDAFWACCRDEGLTEKKDWIYLTAFGSEETRLEIEKRLRLSFLRIPFSVDAFTITRDVITWFDRLLTRHK